MEKPKSWLHTERRNDYTVVVFGRVAIPVSIFVGLYVAWGVVTLSIGVVSDLMGSAFYGPLIFFLLLTASVLGLLFIFMMIAMAIEAIIDVNKKEQ